MTEDETIRLQEAEQVAEDLTSANAALKRQGEKDRQEIARLEFELKKSQDANADLLGEHGVENAKAVISMMRKHEADAAHYKGIVERILGQIPDSMKGDLG